MSSSISASRITYLFAALLLFCVEVLIALFVHDDIIRPHIGDLLVVIMIYCFSRAIFNWSVWKAAIITLLFTYAIETLQYFNVVKLLGLQRFALARIVIGTYFSWVDMLAYTVGIIIVLVVEKIRSAL